MLLDLPRLSLLPESDLVREANVFFQRVGHVPLRVVGLCWWRRQLISGSHRLSVLEYPLAPPLQLPVGVGREAPVACACRMLLSLVPTVRRYLEAM